MDDLALEIGEIDHVEVHDADRAHSRRGEIEREWRAEPSGADGEHACRLELALALEAHLRQQEVAGVSQDFGVGQLGQLRLHRGAPARDARHDSEHVAFAHRGSGG